MTYTADSPITGKGTVSAEAIDASGGTPLPVVTVHAQTARVMAGCLRSTTDTRRASHRPFVTRRGWASGEVVTRLTQAVRNVRACGRMARDAGIIVSRPSIDRVANPLVITVRQHFEILRSIVGPIAVAMVHIFIRSQSPANRPFCNQPMLGDSAALMRVGVIGHPYPDVSVGTKLSGVARHARYRAIATPLRFTRRANECLAAGGTGTLDGHRSLQSADVGPVAGETAHRLYCASILPPTNQKEAY